MRKNPGFTLIELMVVMAIIAILATAGLSAYTGYLRKARDSTRISDLKAIDTVVVASFGITGLAPRLDVLVPILKEMNNNILLEDPMKTKSVCLDSLGGGKACNYYYYPCDNFMGYIIKTSFENYSNINQYTPTTDYYTLGKCTNEQSLDGIGGIII